MKYAISAAMFLIATAASANEIKVGDKVPIIQSTEVRVQIPVGRFQHGDTCKLHPAGDLRINMIAGDSVVLRYTILGSLSWDECPTDMRTSAPVSFVYKQNLLHKQAIDEKFEADFRQRGDPRTQRQ